MLIYTTVTNIVVLMNIDLPTINEDHENLVFKDVRIKDKANC
jgi:hypothetical protein